MSGIVFEQEPGARAGQRLAQVAAMAARGVEVVERARDQQVGVGVEVLGELVALVAQVALDLELDVLQRVVVSPHAALRFAAPRGGCAVLGGPATARRSMRSRSWRPNFSFMTSSLR